MKKLFPLVAFCLSITAAQYPAISQEFIPDTEYSYADLADLSLPSQIVARAEINRTHQVDEERAVGLAPDHVRYFVEAELQNLIRSTDAVPREVTYLVDMPLTAEGRRPRLRGNNVLIMANPVPGNRGALQLVAPDAQIGWTEQREATIRSLLTEANSPDAAGTVTGIGSAFSVPGALPGESETQIFLSTTSGRPLSFSVLRRPNQQPRWSVALGEIVDRATPPPAPNTLLWYRLACSLPDSLPPSSLESADGSQLGTAQADYQLVLEDLGGCTRYRR